MKSNHPHWHSHALALALMCLTGTSAQALSLTVPKLLIDSAVAKKFPKEKYSIRLDNPELQLNRERQKIELCGKWTSKLVQKNGDFCIDFQPQWNKRTGEIEIAKVNLLKLSSGEDKALSTSLASALNGSLLQLLDGTAVYKVPETVGKHLESIEVQDSGIQLNF